MAEEHVSKELFDERTFHINRKLDEIKASLGPLPGLMELVNQHEGFITSLKSLGMKVAASIIVMAIIGGVVVFLSLKS